MLGKLKSGDFLPHLGKRCRLECGEVIVETILGSVEEKPLVRNPCASEWRTPFVLLFEANQECPWSEGFFTIRMAGMAEIRGVYMNRIMAPGPASLFQAVFN